LNGYVFKSSLSDYYLDCLGKTTVNLDGCPIESNRLSDKVLGIFPNVDDDSTSLCRNPAHRHPWAAQRKVAHLGLVVAGQHDNPAGEMSHGLARRLCAALSLAVAQIAETPLSMILP